MSLECVRTLIYLYVSDLIVASVSLSWYTLFYRSQMKPVIYVRICFSLRRTSIGLRLLSALWSVVFLTISPFSVSIIWRLKGFSLNLCMFVMIMPFTHFYRLLWVIFLVMFERSFTEAYCLVLGFWWVVCFLVNHVIHIFLICTK